MFESRETYTEYPSELLEAGPETYHRPVLRDVRQSYQFGGNRLEVVCLCGHWETSRDYRDEPDLDFRSDRLRSDALRKVAETFVEDHLNLCIEIEAEVADLLEVE